MTALITGRLCSVARDRHAPAVLERLAKSYGAASARITRAICRLLPGMLGRIIRMRAQTSHIIGAQRWQRAGVQGYQCRPVGPPTCRSGRSPPSPLPARRASPPPAAFPNLVPAPATVSTRNLATIRISTASCAAVGAFPDGLSPTSPPSQRKGEAHPTRIGSSNLRKADRLTSALRAAPVSQSDLRCNCPYAHRRDSRKPSWSRRARSTLPSA